MNLWLIFQGFTLGAGMIIPIGAQNAFVLNQGMKKNHHLTTATFCSIIDALLISLGVFGGGAFLSKNETLLTVVTCGGIFFLSIYGYLSIKSAFSEVDKQLAINSITRTRRAVILAVLAVSLLNPHVYLDTVVVLGSIGGQFEGIDRISFAVGTMTASFVWFFALSIGAAKLAHILNRKRVKQGIDITIAMIMFFIAVSLAHELLG